MKIIILVILMFCATISFAQTHIYSMPYNDSISHGYYLEMNAPNGTYVGTIKAIDYDIGNVIKWSISSGNTFSGKSGFKIDSQGKLYVNDNSMYLTRKTFKLGIRATDNGVPSKYDLKPFYVFIISPPAPANRITVKSNYPTSALSFTYSVTGDTITGFDFVRDLLVVGQYLVNFYTLGATPTSLSWKIYSGNTGYSVFKLDAVTGMLTLNNPNGFNKYSEFNLVIKVTDSGTNPIKYNSFPIKIKLK